VNDTITQNLLVFGGVLFAIGMVGFLTRRSLILMFLSLEMMLSGVSINLVAFSRHHQNYQGQILAIMVLTVAACEAAIALALVVSLYRRKATLDIKAWDELSETIIPKVVESPVSLDEVELEFPKLTPSGLDPMERPVPANFEAESGEVAERIQSRSPEATTHA
jgi:NADH-quinone oxidoreductase subunit K